MERISKEPKFLNTPTKITKSYQLIGIALNGVVIAGPFDSENKIAPYNRQIAQCGGHSDMQGMYHYHFAPMCGDNNFLIDETQIGWAFDGLKIMKNDFNYFFNSDKDLQTLKAKIDYLKTLEPMATRKCSEKFLEIVSKLPSLIGGSADLAGSNNTKTKNHKIIKSNDFSGNYIHYGVREHAMCGIMNGISLHSGLIPYGGTFLIFSDYCKPSIRLAAMMKQKVIYVFTHDSIG